MQTLIMLICLAGTPGHCREERIVYNVESSGPMACIWNAPAFIATWTEAHPKWRVARWKCQIGDGLRSREA